MIAKLKKHKTLLIVLTIFVLALIYCHFNTFLANDDLPYMYLYRGTRRITNPIQALKNQVADYFHINGRFVVHTIVQTLLIFDKNLWSVLNPILIAVMLLNIVMIANHLNKEEKHNPTSFMLAASLFLLLINYKYIIYWVAGSVNYVFVGAILIGYVYYYLKYGIDNKYLINSLIILFISILHEMSLVFMIVLIIGNLVKELLEKKRINKRYLWYILALILGAAFIFLSPGNRHRVGLETAWTSLSLLGKIKTSTPVVAYNLLNLKNDLNIIPLIYLGSIIYGLVKNKKKLMVYPIIIISLIAYFTNKTYMYIPLVCLLALGDLLYHISNKNYKMVIVTLSFYAIVASTILIPNYADGRPNFYFYLYCILSIVSIIRPLLKYKLFIVINIMMFVLLLGLEVYTYHEIGKIHNKRLDIINECRLTKCQELNLPKIGDEFGYYHIDNNQPSDSKYYTRVFYVRYYHLPKNVKINFYSEE